MAGSFSGHLIDSYNRPIVSSGSMSFNPNMHGTQGTQQSFTMFGTQGTAAYQEMSEATAMKIAHLQAKLNQKLGPEYISQRPGPGGGPKLTYAEGWKVINLANEVFGFNGWSSTVVSLTTDFVDFNEESKRYNIGVTAIIKVTLRDGVFHEDIGYGMIENTKSKGQGLDKCKKEATTDGLKRALRSFGNLMGNCLYDKSYTQEVVKIKVTQPKFDQAQLHRRPEFEDKKPVIVSTPTTNQSYATSSSSSASSATDPRHQNTSGSSASVVIKREPTSHLPSGVNANHAQQAPPKSRPMPPPPPPVQARPTMQQKDQRRVNFANMNAPSVASTSAQQDVDPDDSFSGFSDDDAFLASVDLEDLGPPIHNDDLGRPIADDTEMGPPLDYGDTSVESVPLSTSTNGPASNDRPGASRHSTSGKSSRLEAIIAAQLQQEQLEKGQQNSSSSSSSSASHPTAANQSGPSRISLPPANHNHQHSRSSMGSVSGNENRDPARGQQLHGMGATMNHQQKRSPTPVGGFHYPASNSIQASSRGPIASNSGVGIGVKRPLDAAMASNAQRGSRPGMGLQQASSGVPEYTVTGGRQVLGRLDNGDGGDIKRVRR